MARAKEESFDKEAALRHTLAEIEKKFGKGAVMRLGEKGPAANVEAVSTGILLLDVALGVGGMPCGRIVDVYGPESSGKTTVALHVIASVQNAGISSKWTIQSTAAKIAGLRH